MASLCYEIFSADKQCKAPFQTLHCLLKKGDDLEKLNELASLQNPVKFLRLKDSLEKHISKEFIKRVFKPVNDTVKYVSGDITER